MNNYIYDAETNLFYPVALKPEYVAAGSWPTNGIEIEDTLFNEYSGPQPEGKIRGVGGDGLPCWVNIPPLTSSELIAQAEFQKTELMSLANNMIAPLQDAVDLEMPTAEEVVMLKAWKTYRVLLNRIDTEKAPDIVWPATP